jgi:hypothetical protein
MVYNTYHEALAKKEELERIEDNEYYVWEFYLLGVPFYEVCVVII